MGYTFKQLALVRIVFHALRRAFVTLLARHQIFLSSNSCICRKAPAPVSGINCFIYYVIDICNIHAAKLYKFYDNGTSFKSLRGVSVHLYATIKINLRKKAFPSDCGLEKDLTLKLETCKLHVEQLFSKALPSIKIYKCVQDTAVSSNLEYGCGQAMRAHRFYFETEEKITLTTGKLCCDCLISFSSKQNRTSILPAISCTTRARSNIHLSLRTKIGEYVSFQKYGSVRYQMIYAPRI